MSPFRPTTVLKDPFYVSQWSDVSWHARIIAGTDPCQDPSWRDTGFQHVEDYRFWSWRICGLACLRSVLLARDGEAPEMSALLQQALKNKVYQVREDGSVLGLIYHPFCEWVNSEFSANASVLEHMTLKQVLDTRHGNDVLMLSVGPEIREPGHVLPRKGGHLVLVTDHDTESLTFNNPSGVPPLHANVTLAHAEFDRFFAGRGVRLTLDT